MVRKVKAKHMKMRKTLKQEKNASEMPKYRTVMQFRKLVK